MQANHNEEIRNTRVGGFGGSDAAMFYKLGLKGLAALSQTDIRRILIAKGQLEYGERFMTEAMQLGHDFEDFFAENFAEAGAIREKKYEKKISLEFDTFAHADFSYEGSGGFRVVELKNLKEPAKAATTYAAQLQWYYLLGAHQVTLCVHDSTFPMCDEVHFLNIERDDNYIAVMLAGIRLLSDVWNDQDLFTLREDISSEDLLPFDQQAVQALATALAEQKHYEAIIKQQKEYLLKVMEQNGIKSIKNDLFSITYVAPTERRTFYKSAFTKVHPEIDLAEFDKVSRVSSSIKITMK